MMGFRPIVAVLDGVRGVNGGVVSGVLGGAAVTATTTSSKSAAAEEGEEDGLELHRGLFLYDLGGDPEAFFYTLLPKLVLFDVYIIHGTLTSQ